MGVITKQVLAKIAIEEEAVLLTVIKRNQVPLPLKEDTVHPIIKERKVIIEKIAASFKEATKREQMGMLLNQKT